MRAAISRDLRPAETGFVMFPTRRGRIVARTVVAAVGMITVALKAVKTAAHVKTIAVILTLYAATVFVVPNRPYSFLTEKTSITVVTIAAGVVATDIAARGKLLGEQTRRLVIALTTVETVFAAIFAVIVMRAVAAVPSIVESAGLIAAKS